MLERSLILVGPYALLAAGFIVCMVVFLSLKREIHRLRSRIAHQDFTLRLDAMNARLQEAEQKLAAHTRHGRSPGVAVDCRLHREPLGSFADGRNLVVVKDDGGRWTARDTSHCQTDRTHSLGSCHPDALTAFLREPPSARLTGKPDRTWRHPDRRQCQAVDVLDG